MPKLTTRVPHQLGCAEATLRIERMLSDVRQQFGHEIEKLESVWEDTTLKFLADARGFNVQGHVTVENDAVHVHATLPLAAALLKGYIERTVTEKLGTALS